MAPLKVTYDEVADAAYIYLQPPGTRVAKMYPCDPIDVDGMINIDLDASGRLVGVEVLTARMKLAPQVLAVAEDITRRPAEDMNWSTAQASTQLRWMTTTGP